MIRFVALAAKHTFSYPTVAVWFLVATGATVMGPFGTYTGLTLLPRAVYWFLLCGGSVFLGFLVRAAVGSFIRDEGSIEFDGVTVAGLTAVFSPFVYGLSKVMARSQGTTPPGFWLLAFFVLVISVLITAIRRLHRMHQLPEIAQDEAASIFMESDFVTPVYPAENPVRKTEENPSECRLRQRLPQGMREPILHLSARDHFVDIETETALYSIRMRFSDAVAEMDGVAGHATHRSHWVAANAIRDTKQDGGKLFLVLCNGTEVPVSRTFRPRLEEAGLL